MFRTSEKLVQREFVGGPLDGLVMDLPSETDLWFMPVAHMYSYEYPGKYGVFCHLYQPCEGHMAHSANPSQWLTEEAFDKVEDEFGLQ